MTAAVVILIMTAGLLTAQADEPVRTADDWKQTAEKHMRAGEKTQAAAAFEQVVRLDPSTRILLAPALSKLYAENKTPDKAIAWAKVAMERSPDPQAYLAGIYETLGQTNQAESILIKELGKTNTSHRVVSLSWQLADLQLRQGATNNALKTLQNAAKAVNPSPLPTPPGRGSW